MICETTKCSLTAKAVPQSFERLYGDYRQAYEDKDFITPVGTEKLLVLQGVNIVLKKSKDKAYLKESEFSKVYSQYYEKVSSVIESETREEFARRLKEELNIIEGSKSDRFFTTSWEAGKAITNNSDAMVHFETYRTLSENPKVLEYFISENFVHFLLSPATNADEGYFISIDKESGEITSAYKDFEYRSLTGSEILEALVEFYQ